MEEDPVVSEHSVILLPLSSIARESQLKLSLNRLQFSKRPSPYWLRSLACRNARENPSDKSEVTSNFRQNVKQLEISGETHKGAEVFRGEGYSQPELVNYALGFMRNEKLFLLPVDQTFEMDFQKEPKHSNASLGPSTSQQINTHQTPLPIRIRFARLESDANRRRREQSSLYKHNMARRDPWKRLKVQRAELPEELEESEIISEDAS